MDSNTATVDLSLDPASQRMQPQFESMGSETSEFVEDTHSEGTIPLPELKAMLQQQLEYYFSRENLASDTYLLSQMDSDQYVPISTVANFNQIKRLTKDLNLIVDVLRESPSVQVDEAGEKVRPNHKRCVLILREIPPTTPIKSIEELFSGKNCPCFINCEFAHNNSWYVTFESDEDAQRAYRYLREEVKNFLGKPIMARIKAKPIARAPFMSSQYKNGYRPMTDFSGGGFQQMQTTQTQPTQAAQQRFSYGNIAAAAAAAAVPYNNQQMFQPFYPPTMLQAWVPTAATCFDLGAVISMNGLAPQTPFKPVTNAGRPGVNVPRNRNQKPQNRQQGFEILGPDQNLRFYDPTQSYMQRPNNSSSVVNSGNSFGYPVYSFSNRAPYSLEMPELFSGNGTYNKRQDTSYSGNAQNYVSGHYANSGNKENDKPPHSHTASSTSVNFNARSEFYNPVNFSKENVENLPSNEQEGLPQRTRNNRRRNDENMHKMLDANSTHSDASSTSSRRSPKEMKGEPVKFDLEPASFPPLPGTLDTELQESDGYENRLSDVVKGTVTKSSSKETNTQSTESSHVESAKDNSSPAEAVHVTSTASVAENTTHSAEGKKSEPCNATRESSPPPPKDAADKPSNESSAVVVSEASNAKLSCLSISSSMSVLTVSSTTCSSSTSSSTVSEKPFVPSSVSSSSTKTNQTTLSSVSNYKSSSSCTSSEDSVQKVFINGHEKGLEKFMDDKSSSRRPTYSEVAQRAKEKVEKIATELKEKEKQERQESVRRHESMSSRQSNRGAFRESGKPRSSEHKFLLREFKERKVGNGGSSSEEKEHIRDEPKEEKASVPSRLSTSRPQ